MNCKTFDKELYDYLDGTLAEPDRAEFELHRSGCTRCAARLESESHTARVVRAAVEDACEGLEFRLPSGAGLVSSERHERSRSSPVRGWRIAAAIAGLLVVALLIPAVVRERPAPEAGDRWSEEIHVTYEAGLLDETTLISHDSGVDAIIEIQVSYHP